MVPRACDRGAGQVGLRLLTNKENQEQILVTSFVFDDECCQYLWNASILDFFGVCVYVKSWLAIFPPCPGIIRGARLRMLRSGHSHEDVDQTFGGPSRPLKSTG